MLPGPSDEREGNIKSNGMFILVTFILDFFFYQMLLREGGQPKTTEHCQMALGTDEGILSNVDC